MFRLVSLFLALALVESQPHITTVELDDALPSRGRLGGVSVDPAGYVYVSDFGSTLWRISPAGEVDVLDSSLRGSSGNAVDVAGNVYQASFRDNRVVRIDRDGNLENYATEGLDGPIGLTFDGSGNLYVCNCSGNYIARVDANGNAERFAESPDFDCPNGITFDASGYFVVASFNNGYLVRVSPDGRAKTWLEVPEGRNAHVAATENGVYVTKIESNRIYHIDRAGKIQAFAGTGELGLDDGPALDATLSRPNGIAVTEDGRALYVNNLDGPWRGSEPTNIVLRRIELP
jgi:sugar lactone lactonase YvrE